MRDTSTALTYDYSDAIIIYPNPTTSIVNLKGDKQYDIEVYDMAGNKVMALTEIRLICRTYLLLHTLLKHLIK